MILHQHTLHPTEEEKCQVTLTGPKYDDDNKLVCQLLCSSAEGTSAQEWVKLHANASNGRAAALSLVNQYEGRGTQSMRVAAARAELEKLHCDGNEEVFPFQKPISCLQRCFTILENYCP